MTNSNGRLGLKLTAVTVMVMNDGVDDDSDDDGMSPSERRDLCKCSKSGRSSRRFHQSGPSLLLMGGSPGGSSSSFQPSDNTLKNQFTSDKVI